jgi:hypothetical protein
MAARADEFKLDSPEYGAFHIYAQLTTEKRDLKARLEEVEDELKMLESTLLSYLGQEGYEMVRVAGFTFSPKRDPWVRPLEGITRQRVCDALKESGLGEFVTENYSTRTLTKYVRELEEHYQLVNVTDPRATLALLPAPLEGVLEIRPGFSLQVRAHSKGA